jgi:hypothetical protein
VRGVRPARGTGSGGRPGRAPGRQTHPGHDSPGHLLTCVAPRFISGSVVLPGPTDATARCLHARRAGHLDAAFGRWPAIGPRRDRSMSVGQFSALVTGLFAVQAVWILWPALPGR